MSKPSLKRITQRAVEYLSHEYANAQSELHYNNPFELLVAVVLSAQCTDKRVNLVTPALFAQFPTPERMSQASPDEILPFISSVSYPNSKSRYLSELSKTLCNEFGGQVPCDIDQLQRLPGVGRKTANVVAAVIFGSNVMPVDTHVFRVAGRIGLTAGSTTPLDTERRLVKLLPNERLGEAHHWLLLHGRYTCTARSPKCEKCGLTDVCLYFLSQKKM